MTGHTFATIAVGLREAATRAAMDVEGCEQLAAALPETPGISHTMRTMRERADAIAAAHFFFKALVPHEGAVLAMLGASKGEAA